MSILVADDDQSILMALKLLFKKEQLSGEFVSSPDAVIDALQKKSYQMALIDLNYCQDTTSGQEGLQLIKRIRAVDELIPIVVMTGWGTVDLAVESVKCGASDFIEKPWNNERLISIVRNQIALHQAQQASARLAQSKALLEDSDDSTDMIVESAVMNKLMNTVQRVASSDLNILITGENGTGKSQLAQYIHRFSDRQEYDCITVNMGGVADAAFESEMFGHVKGAFTDAHKDRIGRLELAENGTLFLDEIANTPLNQQAKLLRVLESGEFEKLGSSRTQQCHVRIISATNANPEALIEEQRFRQDLLFRLNGVTLHLPPLRERRDDILPLAQQALAAARTRYRVDVEGFSAEAEEQLLAYHWPGNIRELKQVVERAVLLSDGALIEVENLQLNPSSKQAFSVVDSDATIGQMTLDDAEKWLIEKALQKYDGSAMQAARALGLSRSAFYRRLEKYQLSTGTETTD